jgi:choline dehydrogenase-like flavoprotein
VPSTFTFLPLSSVDQEGKIASAVQNLKLENDNPAAQKTFELQKEWVTDSRVPFVKCANEFFHRSMLTRCPHSVNPFDRFIPGPDAVFEQGNLYMSINSMGLHCFSRGSVHIGSSYPFASPVIDFNMFSDEIDIDLIVAGLNFAKKMIATEPLASLVDGIISPSPECKTPRQIKDFVRKAAATTYHPIATVGMLPKEDGGCVDERLKLYGAENLRVVHCSLRQLA